MSMEQKLDLLLEGMQELKSDVKELKSDVSMLKSDVKELKSDVSMLKSDVEMLKSDVNTLKTNVSELSKRVGRLEKETSELRSVVELDMQRNIQIIADGHVDLFRKLNEALKVEEEKETFLLRFQRVERDVHRLKQVVFA